MISYCRVNHRWINAVKGVNDRDDNKVAFAIFYSYRNWDICKPDTGEYKYKHLDSQSLRLPGFRNCCGSTVQIFYKELIFG